MMEEALKLAKEADTVVLALDEHRLQSGEATSNATIQIPKIQMELLRRVCEVNDQAAVVLFAGRPHVEGKDKDRFRSKYLDIPNEPLYPFGYGLSYTRFALSPVEIDAESITKEEVLHASVNVKNVGM